MVLDLSGCRNIKQLPHGTEQLCNLRRLNISNTMINILPSGFLSALTLLEELLASNALIFQKSLPLSVSEISIDEIISSSRLSSLEVDFWQCDLYNLYACSAHCAQLEKFKFNVGLGEIQEFSEKWSVAFLSISIAKEKISIPANTTELKFIDCYDITELTTCLLHVEKLKKCTVWLSMLPKIHLPRLKKLRLEFMPNLKGIYDGFMSYGFPCSFQVVSCDALKRLPCHHHPNPSVWIQCKEPVWLHPPDCITL